MEIEDIKFKTTSRSMGKRGGTSLASDRLKQRIEEEKAKLDELITGDVPYWVVLKQSQVVDELIVEIMQMQYKKIA